MNVTRMEAMVSDKKIILETGKWAKQANSVVATMGETVILAACVVSKKESNLDYFPLKIDYDEKYYAFGKMRPSPYVKRETKPSDQSVLIGRFIDRSIRPLFPKNYKNEIQIILTVLSYDGVNSPDVLAGIAASAALQISEAPFEGPLSILRVGRKDGQLIINPDHSEVRSKTLDLDVIVSTVKDKVIMLEAGANEMSNDDIYKAIEFANTHNQTVIKLIADFAAKCGKTKQEVKEPEINKELFAKVRGMVEDKIEPIYGNMDKMTRNEYIENLKNEIVETLTTGIEEKEVLASTNGEVSGYFEESIKQVLRSNVLNHGKRIGGREINELRPLSMEVGVLPRPHGSALFQRGETQSLTIVTLAGPGSKLSQENMEGESKERYFHHYNFPPFSVGDIGMRRGPGNRELGHGALAEKAIYPVLPSLEEFPYTIRVVSEILESNGSSSMAASCGSSLSLMHAGVPLKKSIAGIAMGLMVDPYLEEKDRKYVILFDLSDIEDFGGFMDFKVAGTKDGITAIQVDMKVKGIPLSIVKEALEKSHVARLEVLKKMDAVIPVPNAHLSKYAPKITSIKINPDKIKFVIGKGGETINGIIAQTGVEIDISDDGIVSITGSDEEQSNIAISIIKNLTKELKVGEIFEGKITRILDFGVIVDLGGGKDGMCHISELAQEHVNNINDLYKAGDMIKVKILEINPQGRVSLSHKKTI